MDINFSYESHNQTSYLLATFPPSQKLIQYQLQMMVSNDIKGLLPSTKRQSNDDILVYYNITSKISLAQILHRRKLTKKEFLTLLSGAADVWTEIQEYQLESDGLCLDKDYIFVNSDSCEPSFVYLPVCVSSNGVKNLKEFIQRMIIEGSIETSMDNFVQVLLNVLNDPAFDVKKLKDCIKKLNGNSHPGSMNVKPPFNPEPQPVPEPKPEPKPQPAPEPKPQPSLDIPGKDPVPMPTPIKDDIKQEPKKNDKKAGKSDGQKKFILCQALFIVIIAAMVSFGLFKNAETGAIETTNILGAVIMIAGLEFVLYREFMTKKEKEDKKGTSTKIGKKSGKKNTGTSKAPSRKVVIPGEKPQPEEEKMPIVPPVTSTPAPEPVVSVRQATYPYAQVETDAVTEDAQPVSPVSECEETEFWDPSRSTEMYLEYINEGQSVKIPLMKESTLLGRLASQVDFAVNNSKVGKIHAEIVLKDGNCCIKDLNSKNGTYLNGSADRIASNIPYPLTNGTKIALADSEFVYHC